MRPRIRPKTPVVKSRAPESEATKNVEIVEENLFYDQVGFLRPVGVL
jgi:hypothetical protein